MAFVLNMPTVVTGTALTLIMAGGSAPDPGPRAMTTLVYHDDLQRVVLVDGYLHGSEETPERSALWAWNGTQWEQIHRAGPPSRAHSAAAYDAARRQLVVFGGRVGKSEFTRGDTWVWNGTDWREKTDVRVGLRDHHAMAYDARRGRTVLYGGTVPLPNTSPSDQKTWQWPSSTWEFDGEQWANRPASHNPGSRNLTALAYDAKRGVVVLFGGYGPDRQYVRDTWTWDGDTWKQVAVAGPPGRGAHRLAFDEQTGQVLLFGGGNATGRLLDMWRWDGERWEEIALTGPTPGPRITPGMAYDKRRQRLVLYGGFGRGPALRDTWEWDGRTWTERP